MSTYVLRDSRFQISRYTVTRLSTAAENGVCFVRWENIVVVA